MPGSLIITGTRSLNPSLSSCSPTHPTSLTDRFISLSDELERRGSSATHIHTYMPHQWQQWELHNTTCPLLLGMHIGPAWRQASVLMH